MSNKFLSNLPNWDTAPAWANYLAYDADGSIYYFEYEPILLATMWKIKSRVGKVDFIGFIADTENWQTSLQKRPK